MRKLIFLFILFPFSSFPAVKDLCHSSFKKATSKSQKPPALQEDSLERPFQPDLSEQLLFPSLKNTAQKESETQTKKKRRKKLTQEEKDQAEKDFLFAFQNKDKLIMAELIKQFPFLKKVRFTDPSLLADIPSAYHSWCPLGWSPLQIASYKKDLVLMKFLLDLDMEVRTRKKPGGISLESNPLHISIKRDFKDGVKHILDKTKLESLAIKRRFVDEKDHHKKTPWYYAVQIDRGNRILRHTTLLGYYKPSGYVNSYTSYGPQDGFEIARVTGEEALIRQADRYLWAPNYDKYKEIRWNSLRPDLTPP